MLLLVAAMQLVASMRSLPLAAALVGVINLSLPTWDWNTIQRRGARDSKAVAGPAVSGATLCLVTIALTPPTAARFGFV